MSLVALFHSLGPINSGYASKIKFMDKQNQEADHRSGIHVQHYGNN